MKKILSSLAIIIFAGTVLTIGGTGAFFSDTETSSGNTFTAGAIDLKIDNTSYYNGVLNPGTTWTLKDLATTIDKFFNFSDLKPGDYGEDTISLHVDTNNAYLCADVNLTSNDDNDLTEPEKVDDQTQGTGNGAGLGELAGLTNFIWWADDGDNVLETNETVISQGPIGAIGLGGTVTVPLADSQNNIWTGGSGPAPGNTTLYIGKAWCFGTITPAPLAPGSYPGPSADNNANTIAGQPEDGGIHCDGSSLNNASQTDSLTADVKFTAVQSRNNPGFLCTPPRETGKLTVTKIVVNNNGGNNVISDFHLFVDDGFVATEVTSGVQNTFPVDTYNVNESGSDGYQASFSGDCDINGDVTLDPNVPKSCTITNTELPAHITLIKAVTGTPPLASNTTFGLKVDGVNTPTGASVAVTSNAPHTINETGRAGYTFVSITGSPECPAVLGGTATLSEGQAITCTITNHKN